MSFDDAAMIEPLACCIRAWNIFTHKNNDWIKNRFPNIYTYCIEKNIEDIKIILNSGILEKKSKLRSLFEKNKNIICVPFYTDSNQTLSKIINNFFREKKNR